MRATRLLGLATLAAAVALLAFAASAMALVPRSYDSRLQAYPEYPSPKSGGFGSNGPQGIVVDSADHVWVADPYDEGKISEFDAYPSLNVIGEQLGSGRWRHPGYCYFGEEHFAAEDFYIAVHSTTGDLYVADQCGDVDVFDASGAYAGSFPIYSFSGSSSEIGFRPRVAVDNSGTATDGRVYLAFERGPKNGENGYLQLLNAGLQKGPHFTAEKPWVKGTKITGTPAGPFGALADVAVAPDGNVFVLDGRNKRVDEFEPSGEFVREITDAGVPGGMVPMFSGQGTGVQGIGVDPTNGNVLVAEEGGSFTEDHGHFEGPGRIIEFDSAGNYLRTLDGSDTPSGSGPGAFTPRDVAVNSSGYAYVTDPDHGVVDIFNPSVIPPKIAYEEAENPSPTTEVVNATVDPNTAGPITGCRFEYGTALGSYGLGSATCVPDPAAAPPGSNFTVPAQVHAEFTGLGAETTYHYRIVVENEAGTVAKGSDQAFVPHHVHGLRTDPATAVGGTGATLNGSFLGNGEDTRYYFEWGKFTAPNFEGHTAGLPGTDAGSPPGPGRTPVSSEVTGLEPLTKYRFRVLATNGGGGGHGFDLNFTTGKSAPLVDEGAREVRSGSATLTAAINPGGEDTEYHFEWGTSDCSLSTCTSFPTVDLGASAGFRSVSEVLTGLQPDTTYHFRVLATNGLGEGGYDTTFTTFPAGESPIDECPNVLARQQTGAARLLDCRAYELVSAADSGGYDVESDLVPGQAPFGGYSQASGASGASRVLYGVHGGALAGMAIKPTNKGVDPYVATRGEGGWTTAYVGVPGDDPFAGAPFSSIPSGADASLGTFAFGAPGGCSPCFEAGYTGIPLRLPSGALVQGMVPSPEVTAPGPAATPDGFVAEPLSADGSHLVFGSTSRFAPGGNNSTDDVSIYERDLVAGETKTVSFTPGGAPLPCLQGLGNCHSPGDPEGIAALAVSADGSRVLLGQKLGVDAEGNVLWHLYLNVGEADHTVDLTPGAADGAIYDGMTADGSRVFFTTPDALAGAVPPDGDTSADLYEAAVSGAGALSLRRVSSGDAGNTDACDPVESDVRQRWNRPGVAASCDVLGIAGGGGVSATSGSVFFLSPELLQAGHGTPDEPNLYFAAPGAPPRFVATLDPGDPAVVDAVSAAARRETADFQVSPNGRFAAFLSRAPLTAEAESSGFAQVYRYDSAGAGTLDCVSCNPTAAKVEGSASLASDGTSVLDDGRVFFNSPDPLVVHDSDNRQDVYEWKDGTVQLISAGTSPFASSLLGASADGTDAFFFTHDALAPQDHNGSVVKVYDARVDGGFFVVPPPPPCAASDECHGAGSAVPAQPDIRTVAGEEGNFAKSAARECRKPRVRRNGKCVRRHHQRHRRDHHQRGGHHG